MQLRIILIFFVIACATPSFSQSGDVIGRIINNETRETIPFVDVFINKTTVSTSTNENGDFILRNVPYGVRELVIASAYHELIQAFIPVNTSMLDLGLIEMVPLLQESKNLNAGITDSGWEKNLKRFKRVFLGESELAKKCEILNPFVINFSKGPGGLLFASSKEPIEISNMELGYKISYYLTHFELSKQDHSFEGKFRFSEISTKGGATALQWMQNRKDMYLGSLQNLFKAILDNQILENGFYLYSNRDEGLPGRGNSFIADLENRLTPYDTTDFISNGNIPHTYKVILKGQIEVHCRAKPASDKVYTDIPYAVSWLDVDGDTAFVNQDGSVLNLQEMNLTGDMSNANVPMMLPIDYGTEKIVRIKKELTEISADRIEENVYIHLDKPYYYPGEMMWFKAYMNYRYPNTRDSMSRTLYVELISPQRKIVKSEVLRIDNGFANGNWIVTDTLSSGMYYLRSYTNLNRNFAQDDFFIKPIPILGNTEKVPASEAVEEKTADGIISFSQNKKVYGTRDSIALTLLIKDQKGQPVKSNFSISVTDATQVVPVKDPVNILTGFTFDSEPSTEIIKEVTYPVEYGISFAGQYLNKKGQPEKATLSILQGNYEHLSVIETDENGLFVESGLMFYDSTVFRIQGEGSKKKKYDGKVAINKKEVPSLDIEFPSYPFEKIDVGKNQRLISEFEVPKGARLLSEVFIEGDKISNEVVRPYGKADYVVSAKELDISSNNLLQILQGKVPGLVINTVSDNTGVHPQVRIVRASGLTLLAPTEPLVMIDNVPLTGRAGDILQSINAYTIESIEVVTRVSPAYGSAGVNGVISIYTKKGISPDYVPPEKDLQVVMLKGYSTPDGFRTPTYNGDKNLNQVDYRSILYWNPNVTTDQNGEATISFYAGDLETRYRVVVEGINENNEPIRGVHFINVTRDRP